MAGRIPKNAIADGYCHYLTKGVRCGNPTGEAWRLKCPDHAKRARWDGMVAREKVPRGE